MFWKISHQLVITISKFHVSYFSILHKWWQLPKYSTLLPVYIRHHTFCSNKKISFKTIQLTTYTDKSRAKIHKKATRSDPACQDWGFSIIFVKLSKTSKMIHDCQFSKNLNLMNAIIISNWKPPHFFVWWKTQLDIEPLILE